ncbi:Extradiol ring-cleavage dioxygenase class III enzyme subunit B [Suillus discolor]|uniref:Extradiol ring-cleavage dioxygenase class III enzyme subunit B n=1 Tax=Suillus discolor TaxID=1912936 RepID=A0A9P7FES7_9AGAM|nr:Extradiol ring-cleavage dioxygenase class III enzyme subunit B [Suillus discolor]KAG2115345.1 Extradiol ring-cleavage dioxygenase class III enzyme subunit B [Suillus discolor]
MSFPKTQSEWRTALDALPSTPEKIPAFFFGHGSPMLIARQVTNSPITSTMGPGGDLAIFLRDLGPVLRAKYKPKGIVVFSAHWETIGVRHVTDYGDRNPLLMDYFGFEPYYYQQTFESKGNRALAERIVLLYKEVGGEAKLFGISENRGWDGRTSPPRQGPGFDHGVFVPFKLMFGDKVDDVPIVQVSIERSGDPEQNWAVGKALSKLREEGILILAGGLTVHNLHDRKQFSEKSASPDVTMFDQAITVAASKSQLDERKQSLFDLMKHDGFAQAHPSVEHFVPLYVAAGAGEEGGVQVVSAIYSAPTIAFGI